MQGTTYQEEDETISLCDLTLYSDQSAEWNSIDRSQTSNSSSSAYFEFFDQELDASITATTSFPHENIIFCGKLIPYKQQTVHKHDSSHLAKPKNQADDNKMCELDLLKGLSRWKFSYSTKNGTRNTAPLHKKQKYNANEFPKGHKMSILTSSSSGKKDKWYFFLFGISRFSTEMKLRDIKSRRSCRRSYSPPHSPPPPPRAAMFGFQNWDEEVNEGRSRGWWLRGLIRALSCGGNYQSTTMDTAAIG